MSDLILNIANSLLQEERKLRSRQRGKLGREQFITAVTFVLNEIIQAYCAHPNAIAGISRNKNTYGNRRYAPKGLTATALLGRIDKNRKKIIGALDLLQVYGWIRQIKGGFFNHINGFGEVTKYQATEKLIHQINDPVIYPLSSPIDLDQDTIILRDRGDDEEKNRRKVVDFTDNEQTILWRKNLRTINECLSSHWVDVDMSDAQWDKMQKVIIKKKERNRPVHLNRRILFRIFSNGSFKEGGRFYRAWWQEIPSPYRSLITINSTRTDEYDYSTLNPTMMYALAEKELDGDAYNIGIDEGYRYIIKQCFNAMVQAEHVLLRGPRTIKFKSTGLNWHQIVEAILKRHKDIKDMFFRGLGNTLQFEDSQIAEQILLHFSKKNIPILPVHDSFLARHGDTEELFGLMDELFEKRFKRKCKIKMEKKFIPVEFTKMDSVENIIKVNEEHSMWNKRHGY